MILLEEDPDTIVAVPHVSRVANGKTDWWTAIHLISGFRAANYEDTRTKAAYQLPLAFTKTLLIVHITLLL
jgi:hypothetical protein